MARIAARACAPRRDAHRRERAGVISDAADTAHFAIPGRRRGGSHRPPGDRPDRGGPRTPIRNREQGRCRRGDRDRCHRQGDAGRLHASAHHAQSHDQRRAQCQAALRCREGPRAGLGRGRGAGIARESSVGAVRDLCGLHRKGQEASRQAELLLGRQRHAAACDDGIAAAAYRRRGRPLFRTGARHRR